MAFKNKARERAYKREWKRKWRIANPELYREQSRKEALRFYYRHRLTLIPKMIKARSLKRAAIRAAKALTPIEQEMLLLLRLLKKNDTRNAWRKANPERVKAWKHREYLKRKVIYLAQSKAWRLAHPELCRGYSRAYHKRKPEMAKQQKYRRRAREQKARVENCASFIKGLKEFSKSCYWCGKDLIPSTVTIDHVIPLVRGGPHSKKNLVACCFACNVSKGSKLPNEWFLEGGLALSEVS